jgi:hypothetical protein
MSEATCSVKAPPCERPTSLYSTGPRSGSSYAVSTHHRLIDPIRPTRGHVPTSPPRLIWNAFAVRERLGDPRVVPRFRLSILPSMSSSTSPGSRPLHVSSSFAVRICLRRRVIGSALPMLAISGLTGSPLLRPAELLASLTGDFYFRAFNGLVTLPVAGYHYGGNWTISTGGTPTRWTDD